MRAMPHEGRALSHILSLLRDGGFLTRERARLWARLISYNPPYAAYEQMTARRIPVVVHHVGQVVVAVHDAAAGTRGTGAAP